MSPHDEGPPVGTDSRELVRAASVNLLGMLAKASRTLFTFFVTRVGGPAVFGLFTLATGVVEVVTRFSIFGMDKSLLKFVPEARREGGTRPYRLLSAAFLTSQALGLVVTLAVVVGAAWISETWLDTPELVWPLRLVALSILPVTLMNLVLAATKALKIMSYDALVSGGLFPLSLLLFSLPILWTEADIVALAVAYALAGVAGVAVSLWLFRRHFSVKAAFTTAPGTALGEMVRFSTPLGLHDFILYLAMKVELFILAFFVQPAAVGVYALAAELAFVLKKFRQIFDPILLPLMAEARGGGQMDRVEANLARVIRWVLMLGVFYVTSMILFGPSILGLFGEEFTVGATVLVVLCLAQMANVATGTLDLAMIVAGRPRINLLNISLILVAQTGLNLWLIPRYGIVGAGVAALGAFVFIGLVRLGQSLFLLELNPFRQAQLKPIAAGALAGLALVAVGARMPLPDLPFGWVIGIVILGLVYLLLLRILGFEEEDADLLKRILPGRRGSVGEGGLGGG